MSGHNRNISLTPPESPEGALSSSSSHTRRSPSNYSADSSASSVPSAPHPSADPEAHADACPTVHFASQSSFPSDDKEGCNVFKMAPTVALTLLARSIELIVSLTPEEKSSPPAAPMRPSAAFPNIASNPGWVNPFPGHRSPSFSPSSTGSDNMNSGFAFTTSGAEDIDGVMVKKRSPSPSASATSPPSAPLSSPQDPFPGKVVGEGVEAMDNMTQYSTITRKFWSKTAPPISVEDYLFRVHRYCPLSTAVYLAASLYIHRLSLLDKVLPITPLSVHRVLIAALRVAAKALEDCQHSQSLFAKVGGLTETELSKLEVSFCFLISFDLKVDEEMLEQQARVLKQQAEKQVMIGTIGLMKGRRSTIKEEDTHMVRERSRSRSRALSPRPRKIMIDV